MLIVDNSLPMRGCRWLAIVFGLGVFALGFTGCGNSKDNAPSTTPPAVVIPKPANATQNAPPPSTSVPAGTSGQQPK